MAPVRRSRGRRGDDNPENEEDDDFGFGDDSAEASEDEKPRAQTRRSSRRRSQRVAYKETENDDEDYVEEEEDKDEDEDEDQDGESNPRARKSSRKKQRTPAATQTTTTSCPHCGKKFQAEKGLEYHLSNFVCRPAERPGGPVVKGKRARSASPSQEDQEDGKRSYKRLRGKLEDRTCPKCGRVFTSILGLNYHLEKRVCEKAVIKEKPFPTLEPGTKVVSPFGVVEVVRDDRALPVAEFPADLKQLVRRFQAFKQKRDVQTQKAQFGGQTLHLYHRKRLGKHYERGHLNRESVFSIYFRGDPRSIPKANHVKRPVVPPNRPDPCFPEGSFPDRIVECILVQDNRVRHYGEESTGKEGKAAPNPPATNQPTRLFLQRRILTEIYQEDAEVFVCSTCGASFGSRPGLSHHTKTAGCVNKAEENRTKRSERLETIETRANNYVLKGAPRKKAVEIPANAEPDEYVPVGATSKAAGGAGGPSLVLTKRQEQAIPKPSDNFVDPRVTLKNFEDELKLLHSKMIGPMYPAVFKALRFRKATIPPKRKKKKKKKKIVKKVVKVKRVVKVKKRRPKPQLKPAPSLIPPSALKAPPASNEDPRFSELPPIIDVRALVTEVNTGRYPSIKQNKGEVERETKCSVCRKQSKSEQLVGCDFCTHVFHPTCLLQRFTVKAPEPDEAIMCHNCIGIVMARRARAEKRRLEKQGVENHLNIIQRKSDVTRTRKELVEGKEYECVLEQANQAADLVEMLRNAKTRLGQAVAVNQASAARRAAIIALQQH